jgi:hypothetical protein
MKLEVTYKTYDVELDKYEWNKLDSLKTDEVFSKLKDAGIDDRSIEYNGHFGRSIFFRAPVEVSEETILKALQELIGVSKEERRKYARPLKCGGWCSI